MMFSDRKGLFSKLGILPKIKVDFEKGKFHFCLKKSQKSKNRCSLNFHHHVQTNLESKMELFSRLLPARFEYAAEILLLSVRPCYLSRHLGLNNKAMYMGNTKSTIGFL